MEKYVCIHGHFYQPPRENPWLESVELQDSAAPYHDWNERITAECYAPNSAARILGGDGRINEIVSNYSRISFNFGPTLLAWMQDKLPLVHSAIVEADRASRERFSGHGSAMAQVYNHMIMPLANRRDKLTQVIWGIRDFEARFGRKPEGMWLAETAADIETLDVLAQAGIKFTVLSPFQASRAREIGKRHWRDVNGGQIDPTQAYLIRLLENRSIAAFFYDAPVSQAVAFERLLVNGERLASRITSAFSDRRSWDQLVHIATDGESYGHHHKHGEMALAYALNYIESNNLAKLTNYGEYLEKHPPTREAQIHEKSSWSCVHGVGRWMRDCGCNSGGHGDWNQSWRAPLRNALDWLRDQFEPLYQEKAGELLHDPWRARDEYISVMLDRGPESRSRFFKGQARRELNAEEQVRALKLLELQRHAMLMYTSCGWFFDELSGIETVQVIQYAARVLQLAKEVIGADLEPGFLERLEQAKSNISEHGDGRQIYEKFVRPAMIDWRKAVAHYGISSLFNRYPETIRVFSFSFQDEQTERLESGKTRLIIGRTRITSEITQECGSYEHAMLYMGEHNVTGGIREAGAVERFHATAQQLKEAYNTAEFPQIIRMIDQHFGGATYSLKSLFKDEQRKILHGILASAREDLAHRFQLIAERYGPLMKFLQNINAPFPPALETAADFVLREGILRALQEPELDLAHLGHAFKEAALRHDRVLDQDIAFALSNRFDSFMTNVALQPSDAEQMSRVVELAALIRRLPLAVNTAGGQNVWWELLKKIAPGYQNRALEGDAEATEWLQKFHRLGEELHFNVQNLLPIPEQICVAA